MKENPKISISIVLIITTIFILQYLGVEKGFQTLMFIASVAAGLFAFIFVVLAGIIFLQQEDYNKRKKINASS